VTQFEATDARRALPCVDEPAAKARFDVTLLVSPLLHAVSNMPVLTKTTTGRSADEPAELSRGLHYPAGLSRYSYYSSPIMSTYLLAMVVGEFDYISKMSSGGTEVRVYTGLGKTHLGRFAMDTAVAALEFYNDYFGIAYVSSAAIATASTHANWKHGACGVARVCYRAMIMECKRRSAAVRQPRVAHFSRLPAVSSLCCSQPLPKMDLLAIPDFAAGAMENCRSYAHTQAWSRGAGAGRRLRGEASDRNRVCLRS